MEGCSYPEEQHTHSTCSCDPSQQQAGQIPQGFRDSRQQQQQFFTHYFHFATGKTVEDHTKHNERSQEYSGWVQEFFLHGPNQFANNPTSAFRLQVERTIKNDRFWPQGNFLSFSSSPNVWAETPETSQTRDFKTKAFKNAGQCKKGSHRRKLWPRPSLLFHP